MTNSEKSSHNEKILFKHKLAFSNISTGDKQSTTCYRENDTDY